MHLDVKYLYLTVAAFLAAFAVPFIGAVRGTSFAPVAAALVVALAAGCGYLVWRFSA